MSLERNDHTKRAGAPIRLGRAICAASLIAQSISGCSSQASWSESYNLRQWERSYLQGQTLYLAKRYDQARVCYEDALSYAAKLKPDACRLSDTLARLGNCTVMLHDVPAAQVFYERAIAVLRATLKQDPAGKDALIEQEYLAYSLGRLGALHEANHQLEPAKNELQDALAVYEQVGVTKPNSKIDRLTLSDYADTLAAALHTALEMSNIEDAGKLYQQTSLPQLSTSFSPAVSDGINKEYAALLVKTGRGDQAGGVLAAGRWRAECALAVDALKSDPALAEKHYRDALAIAQRAHNSFFLAVTYAGLGDSLSLQSDLKQSSKCYEQAIDQCDAIDPSVNRIVDSLLAQWARVSVFQPLPEIEPRLNRWLAIRTELDGAKNERTGEVLATMACVYDYNGEKTKSAVLAEHAFAILKNAEDEQRMVSFASQSLGDLLFCQGRYDLAQQLYQHLLDRNRVYGHQSGLPDVELYLRMAAVANCGGSQERRRQYETMAMQIMHHLPNPPHGVYYIAKSLAYLLSDLERHKQPDAVAAIAASLHDVMAIVPPVTDRDQHFQQIAIAALDSAKNNTAPNIKRIILTVQPGSLEATLAAK